MQHIIDITIPKYHWVIINGVHMGPWYLLKSIFNPEKWITTLTLNKRKIGLHKLYYRKKKFTSTPTIYMQIAMHSKHQQK